MKLHEATQMFEMVDYVREMIVKKSCKYGKYESFERLFFLFCLFVCLFFLNTGAQVLPNVPGIPAVYIDFGQFLAWRPFLRIFSGKL